MNNALNQLAALLKSLPLSKKISMAFIVVLVLAGFVSMFFWANQEDYQVLFNNLSAEDGGAIVSRLREMNIPYKVEANGTLILVPSDKVHESRLSLAGEGLPNGGNVGFEIFDRTDFRTPKFVQELNYRRALQGELARTINQFSEVKNSRVFIVIPKDTLFVEESKPASASIQLELISALQPAKLAAIVHLVANAVEGLEPDQVTVVDTSGRIIFKGGSGDQGEALLSGSQLEYRQKVENEIRDNVQTMLEAITGAGKAIVRVNAEIDFNRTTLSEEEYDPSTQVVRSMRDIEESLVAGRDENDPQTILNQRAGVLPASGPERSQNKKDILTNYEINKVVRTVVKPAGTIKRVSVAAVIDGTYRLEKQDDGAVNRIYVPRSEEEMQKFEEIVKRAMGFSEDREDRVSVSCIPFSDSLPIPESEGEEIGGEVHRLLWALKKPLINLALVVFIFLLVVRPLLKGMKRMGRETVSIDQQGLIAAGADEGEPMQIPASGGPDQKERIMTITKQSPEKAKQLIKGWIGEPES